jgi:hypothetical protein
LVFKRFYPADAISSCDVEKIEYDGDLRVSVRGHDGAAVRIDFKEVRAFRVTDEGERTALVEQMPPKKPLPRALIYEIEESPFIQWLSDES